MAGEVKLGSLFDGSGGFPLAGVLHGVEPVWASEIEPYPVRVTTARFPQMKHLGDVTKIDGAAIEPVDIITFGSPCQDLSVAGKQAGLHKGERSNLFFEAIRIIKEMRRSTDGIYPRIAIWENVPGAFSSNKGADFRAVLQAFVRLREQAADVPMPKGNKWATAGCVVGNGYSIAWRTLDAQYNGVPQRRRRIYLIADFGSERAGEILFEQESVRGHSAESGTARQGAADNAEGSAGRGVFSFMGGQGSRARSIAWTEEATPPLKAVPSGSNTVPDICYPINTMVATRHKADDGRTTFGVGDNGDPQFTIGAAHEHAVCYPIDSHQQDSRFRVCDDGVGNNGPMVLYTKQAIGHYCELKVASTQQARQYKSADDLVVSSAKPPRKYIIRRLTPLECCRLQGFPDWWEDGVQGSDSARYKMWGNGLALPNAAHVVGCAVKLIREATE